MADYGEDQEGAYETIVEAGAAITFIRPANDAVPIDPAFPWEGFEDADPINVSHFAVIVPFSASINTQGANPWADTAIIPGLNLPFEVVKGVSFSVDGSGIGYDVENVQRIAPDGVSVIVYICEVTKWPAT